MYCWVADVHSQTDRQTDRKAIRSTGTLSPPVFVKFYVHLGGDNKITESYVETNFINSLETVACGTPVKQRIGGLELWTAWLSSLASYSTDSSHFSPLVLCYQAKLMHNRSSNFCSQVRQTRHPLGHHAWDTLQHHLLAVFFVCNVQRMYGRQNASNFIHSW